MFEAMKHQKDNPRCYMIYMMEELVQEVTTTKKPSLLVDRVLINSIEQVEEEVGLEMVECLLQLQATHVDHATRKVEELGGNEQQSQPTVQKDPELKELSKHVKYVFLGEKPLQPDIISNSLSILEEEKFL